MLWADAVISPKGSAAFCRRTEGGERRNGRRPPFATSIIWCSASRPLQAEGIWVLGMPMETDATLFNTALTGPIRLGHGQRRALRRLTRERCDALVAILMMGAVESLNVSVATAVCLVCDTGCAGESGSCWKVSPQGGNPEVSLVTGG